MVPAVSVEREALLPLVRQGQERVAVLPVRLAPQAKPAHRVKVVLQAPRVAMAVLVRLADLVPPVPMPARERKAVPA